MSTLIPMAGSLSRSFSSTAAMVGLLFVGFLLSAIHVHAVSPDPGTVKITGFNSLCSHGRKLEPKLSDDGNSLKVNFGLYVNSDYCVVSVSLSYPEGFRFRLVDVTMTGHAAIGEQGSANIQSTYHTNGRNSNIISRLIRGPIDDGFHFVHGIDIEGRCGSDTESEVVIRTDVRFHRSGVHPQIDMTKVVSIAWESC